VQFLARKRGVNLRITEIKYILVNRPLKGMSLNLNKKFKKVWTALLD